MPDQFQPFEFPKQSKHSSRNKPPENKDVGWISFHEPFHFIPSNRHGNAYTRTQTLIQEIVLQKHRNVDGYNEHWTNNALMHHSFQVFDWFFFGVRIVEMKMQPFGKTFIMSVCCACQHVLRPGKPILHMKTNL